MKSEFALQPDLEHLVFDTIEREGGNTFRDDCRQGMGLIKRWRCGR